MFGIIKYNPIASIFFSLLTALSLITNVPASKNHAPEYSNQHTKRADRKKRFTLQQRQAAKQLLKSRDRHRNRRRTKTCNYKVEREVPRKKQNQKQR